MAFKLCSSLAATYKAGSYASGTALGNEALLNSFSNNAEGVLMMKTRKDWSSAYATTPEAIKMAIADAVSCDIGNKIINYDKTGFIKGDAQTTLDVNKDTYDSIVKDLREDQNQKLNK
jgi:hypothetical protein